MSNKIKGIVAIASGVLAVILVSVFAYGQKIQKSVGIKKSQTQAASPFGGYSKSVAPPKFSQYGDSAPATSLPTNNMGSGLSYSLSELGACLRGCDRFLEMCMEGSDGSEASDLSCSVKALQCHRYCLDTYEPRPLEVED